VGVLQRAGWFFYEFLFFFFFFFFDTGVWTQAYTLNHSTSPSFVMGFWYRVSWTICSGWLWTVIFLISASWVARITDVSHLCLALFEVLVTELSLSPSHFQLHVCHILILLSWIIILHISWWILILSCCLVLCLLGNRSVFMALPFLYSIVIRVVRLRVGIIGPIPWQGRV
jgi:hypothetical protein